MYKTIRCTMHLNVFEVGCVCGRVVGVDCVCGRVVDFDSGFMGNFIC